MKLQKPQYVLHIFVKLIFRLTTNVTSSPTSSFLAISAAITSEERSVELSIKKSFSASCSVISLSLKGFSIIFEISEEDFDKVVSKPLALLFSIRLIMFCNSLSIILVVCNKACFIYKLFCPPKNMIFNVISR